MKQLVLITMIVFLVHESNAQQWLKVDSVFNPSGVAVQNFSAPEFADLNADGKPDLILGNGSSAKVGYFRNLSPNVPPKFLADTSMLSSIYAGGMAGTNSDYPTTCDLDGDGDLDLLVGGYNGILFYRNIGDTVQPIWQRVDSVFTDVNAVIGSDAKPAFADLDGDGDLDLLVGIGESLLGGPTPGITMGFRNTGTRFLPHFVQDDALVAGIPDIGRNSYPTLKDLDGDGDFDLLLGRDLQTFVYFRNTGSAAAPVWTGNSTTFNVVESTTYWKNPTLYDLDKDNDLDLIYGTSDGTIYYYQNIGTRTAPQFQFNPNYFPVIRTAGNAATASLADFDNDGDVDMISGDWLGGFQYFRNDGTPTAPRFTKTTSTFTSLNVSSYSSPVFVDLDNDGDKDIVSGALNGTIYCYINNGTSFTQNTTMFAGIDVGWMSAPA
ncbi:MAG: VCBS repeat-containing protein, partial [bacterium]